MFLVELAYVKISGMFLPLSSKTSAHPRQDFYDSKQYPFCPHVALQSAQNESSSEGIYGIFAKK